MSQYDWLTIDPDKEDGTELAARLNAWMAAVESNHRGTAEPTYVRAGMVWPKQVSGTVEQLFYYDGTQSVLLATVNPTAHTVSFPAASLPAATTSAAGAAELATTTEQLTGTDATRSSTPDSIAALWEDGGNVNASGSISLGEGGSFNLITSTANITGFTFATAKTGRRATVRFNTVRTLVNGANLILPSGADIVTAVGDLAEVEDRGGGVARVKYYRADGRAVISPSSVVRDYIAGLTVSNNATTPNTKIDVAAGTAADSTNADMIDYAGGTLDLTTTGVNGLRTGSLAANTDYALFVIKGTSGVGLFADTALTPGTRPSGYTASWRRRAVFRTDASGHIIKFINVGNQFFWNDPSQITETLIDINPGATNGTLPIMTGKKWPVKVRVELSTNVNTLHRIVVYDPDGAAQTPTLNATPLEDIVIPGTGNAATRLELLTNTSSQVAANTNALNSAIRILLMGWTDDGL